MSVEHYLLLSITCCLPRAAWLASSDWMQQLEALLAVRQPSEEDLGEVGGRARGLKLNGPCHWGMRACCVLATVKSTAPSFSSAGTSSHPLCMPLPCLRPPAAVQPQGVVGPRRQRGA